MTDEQKIDEIRRKLCTQAAALVNKAGIPPLVVANLLFEAATAVALEQVPISELSAAFRHHADTLDDLPTGTGYDA